jgi:hypothetical protein
MSWFQFIDVIVCQVDSQGQLLPFYIARIESIWQDLDTLG